MVAHKLLLVDDEQNILDSLERLFLDEDYHIEKATSGREALLKIERHDFSLIISDQRMPEMTGAEFLEKAKERSPETIRIMLTGHSDIKDAASAVNQGEIYKYVNKPWDNDELRFIVKRAIRQYELVRENRELQNLLRARNQELEHVNKSLEDKVRERTEQIEAKNRELENSFITTIRVFTNLISHYDSFLGDHCKRVSVLSDKLAAHLTLSPDRVLDCEVAGLLHDLGKIGLHKRILSRDASELTKTELAQLERHPVLGQESIMVIDRLNHVGVIIRHHHERYDGKGYPDGLQGEDIPLESRILAVTDSYDLKSNARSYFQEASPKIAVTYLKKNRGNCFDPAIVNAFLDFLDVITVTESHEVAVPLSGLKQGMKLSRDVLTKGGRLLIERACVLREIDLERIHRFHKMDPIVDNIFVYRE